MVRIENLNDMVANIRSCLDFADSIGFTLTALHLEIALDSALNEMPGDPQAASPFCIRDWHTPFPCDELIDLHFGNH